MSALATGHREPLRTPLIIHTMLDTFKVVASNSTVYILNHLELQIITRTFSKKKVKVKIWRVLIIKKIE
jgi:hypothetical protein